ncbi:unnamed protein product [Tenebrio molitor]|nr:unnamed protein product [Tenebrio molitor]
MANDECFNRRLDRSIMVEKTYCRLSSRICHSQFTLQERRSRQIINKNTPSLLAEVPTGTCWRHNFFPFV